MNPRAEFAKAWGLVRGQGLPWVVSRLLLEARKRLGVEAAAFPARPWRPDEWRAWVAPAWRHQTAETLLEEWRGGPGGAWGRARRTPAWSAALAQVQGDDARKSLVAAAEAILGGRFRLFGRHTVEVGFPPAWQANPLTGGTAPKADEVHWSRVPMRSERFGDLKLVWELSRGEWAFTLARAYACTGDNRFAEGFWRLWEDWIDANPPHGTAQWKCGQETSLRLMAVTFAVQVLADAPATTAERFARHLGAVAALADRVRRGERYAEMQNNNHSMSEGVGAYTVGVNYPFLTEARPWRDWGWERLNGEMLRLVRPDGTFIQKSHNYHRLMLHLYLWGQSLAAVAGDALPGPVRARLRAAIDYLQAVVDPESGEAPNFGNNDGALILPLSEALYTDFRPTMAAARFWADKVRVAVPTSAYEASLWLFGPELFGVAAAPPPARGNLALERGGIYTLHQDRSWIFAHAESFRDRPMQADELHVDLWWRGLNMARDPGTFMYYGPPELYAWFRGTRCHNTVAVDDRDQMEPGPRFLWASRAQASVRMEGSTLFMSHDGYRRLAPPVTHERRIRRLGSDMWLVVDDLRSAEPHRYSLHWLLPDVPFRRESPEHLVLETEAGSFHVRIVPDVASEQVLYRGGARQADGTAASSPEAALPWGWESRHYAERTPALSLVVTTKAAQARFATVFSPHLLPGSLALRDIIAAGGADMALPGS